MHRIMRDSLREASCRMLGSVALGAAAVGSNIALMATAGYLIAKAATHVETILLLWIPIVSVRFFGISRAVFRYIERLASHDVTLRMLAQLRVRLFALLEPRWPAASSRWTQGELFNTMMTDIEILQNMFLHVLSPPVIALLACGLSLLIVAPIGGLQLTAVLLAGLLLVGLCIPFFSHLVNRRLQSQLVAERASLSQQIVDLLTGMTDIIMADDDGRRFVTAIHQKQTQMGDIQVKLGMRQGLMEALNLWGSIGTAWIMLMLALPRVQDGTLNGVQLCVIILTALASFEAVLPLGRAFAGLEESRSALRRLKDMAEWPLPAPDHTPSPAATAESPLSCAHPQAATLTATNTPSQRRQWHIRVEHVSFAYAKPQRNVLSDISFAASPGKHLAIVGQNGAGKSTLIHLLTRLWDVSDGRITIDGIDIRQLPNAELRAGFAVVSPQTHLFHASIADNLRIANPDASVTAMWQAIAAAQLQDWIDQLPDGLDTVIDETAYPLAGGERQRLAIARAILAHPAIYILDEPFESLDAPTAARIRTTLSAITQQKTAIWITHQLRWLPNIDEILVLHHGRIVERGQHTELLNQMGRYRQMWDIEADLLK